MRRLLFVLALALPLTTRAETYVTMPASPACGQLERAMTSAQARFIDDTRAMAASIREPQALDVAACLKDVLGLHLGFSYVNPMEVLDTLVARACLAARTGIGNAIGGMLDHSLPSAGVAGGVGIVQSGTGGISASGSDASGQAASRIWDVLK